MMICVNPLRRPAGAALGGAVLAASVLALAACAARAPRTSEPAPAASNAPDHPAATGQTARADERSAAAERSGPAGAAAPSDAPADPTFDDAGSTRLLEPRGPAPQPEQPDPVLARGRELFARQCAICHGENADGAGRFAYLMNPRPRDFTRNRFKLATTDNAIPTEADLVRTISRGMPGSAMPPWGHLPKTDLEALARYVRRVYEQATRAELDRLVQSGAMTAEAADAQFAVRTRAGEPLRVPPEPPFDDLRWFRGRRIYLEACAACHGVSGDPVPEAVKFDEAGYPVPPRSFVQGIFKGGSEGHQLYARIVKGLPGTPMPAYEGVYNDDEIWDLIHYVQSLARSGAQLRAQLQQGTIVAARIRGDLPTAPTDAAWEQARPVYVALTPLWWSENRIEGLVVQALHNDLELALRFSWIDPIQDGRAVRSDEFRDAVAVQFSLTPDPPFYMGDATQHGGVNIWMWKADRQADLAAGYQDVSAAFPTGAVDAYPERVAPPADPGAVDPSRPAIMQHDPAFITAWGAGNLVADPQLRTPVECLVAQGPGTLSGRPANVQLVQGSATYERGVWYVQMKRSMELPHDHAPGDGAAERLFRPGDYLPVSFAVWNGAAGDRDGKKNISIWQKLVIE